MSDPIRVQLSRRKGWRMPPNTVSVARPTKWGNPFRPLPGDTTDDAVASYRQCLSWARRRAIGWTAWGQRIVDGLPELRGKNLACWCPLGQPCHADVLLEIANAGDAIGDRSPTGPGRATGPVHESPGAGTAIAQPSVLS